MIKSIVILGLSLLFFKAADAQKSDKAVYYLTYSGAIAPVKDSADFILVISPPDSTGDKNLYVVKEFYINGKIRLIGSSSTKTYENLKLQGVQITFFPNGRRMRVENFRNGKAFGNVINYYPNGKLYSIKSYINEKNMFLKQCNDSTGRVIAENGNGKWIEFLDETFTVNRITGEIKDGLEEGAWWGFTNNAYFEHTYHKGERVSSSPPTTQNIDRHGDSTVFISIEQQPDFPGGMEAFSRFISKNIRYPELARKNNTCGTVIISFVVERDGSLTEVKVERPVGDGCEEEAVRVIKLSPKWRPGLQNSKPIRVAYSVPIAFRCK
ncbi:MAG: hypothetical protein JWR02_888 [Mucilaginibacter sp.]|nr:hypothetical protein [Mucilaginibacter sp.]